jgi:hypothetical protein
MTALHEEMVDTAVAVGALLVFFVPIVKAFHVERMFAAGYYIS